MIRLHRTRLPLLAFLTLALALPRSAALLNIDGSRNQVFVFGSVSFGYSSNIFSDSTGRGDYSTSASAGLDLKRRAGIIAVNSTLKFDYQAFTKYTDQNSINPNFYIEFSKTTGRTTGSFTVSAFRESRSDSAVNLRTSSWNFPLGLSLKYPINDKFYATSGTNFLNQHYTDNSVLVNLTDYSESIDLFYVYTSKLDLLGGYRIRITRTSRGADSIDHWFNLGATGGLFAKLNGTVRVGYQIREQTGVASGNFTHLNALASLAWPMTRKLSFGGQISRDFNTIATGDSVDSTGATLSANYSYNRKLVLNSSVSYGRNHFLGRTQADRHDDFFGWSLGASYKVNEHLNVAGAYNYFRNSSTLAISEFQRVGYTLDVSSRF